MPVQVVADTGWTNEENPPLMLHAMHQDQVVSLPDDAEVFLSSDFCPISGFTYANSALAIQQHPDFTVALNQDLIEKRVDRIGNETARKALESLKIRDDTETSVEWMADFLKATVGATA